MPRIVEECFYDGAEEKISRLGLSVLASFALQILEERNKNSGGVVRKMIDVAFAKTGVWAQTASGDIDWVRCKVINGTRVCLGVEVQVSARSDLIIRDIVHLRSQLTKGLIDLGVLIVPSDRLSYFLTDRAPSMSDAKRVVGEMHADDLPLVLIAIEHDGATTTPLPKMITRQGREQTN